MTALTCPCGLAVEPKTKGLHRPTCPLDTRPQEDRIAQAIGDPGSVVERKGKDSDSPESITRWSTRAVLAVLAADMSGLSRGLMYIDDAPGGEYIRSTDYLRCQVRVVNADGYTFRCGGESLHSRRHSFVAEAGQAVHRG